jgi:hypothetical protein
VPYYVSQRGEGELYAMNLTLSEEEARRYGQEGETVVVTAVYVWTSMSEIESFDRFFVSPEETRIHPSANY